jgi:hypothetical protein
MLTMEGAVAEAWLFAAIVVAGLAVGSLGLLLLGRLLGREWLTPLEDELEPAAWAIPVAMLLAVPLAFMGDGLDPWPGGGAMPVRAGIYFLVWIVVAFAIASLQGRLASAAGLVLLLPTTALAGVDWVVGRGSGWVPGLFGFAFAASQLAPALASALLANALQREHVSRTTDRSLASALLTLTLAVGGLWFVQFLAAWMGNLPAEAGWYQDRLAGGRWIALALPGVMLGAAVLLLMQRHRGSWTMLAAASLILLQHPLHMIWLLRPVGRPAPNLVDLAALVVVGAAWVAAWLLLMRRRDARAPQSGRPGSS